LKAQSLVLVLGFTALLVAVASTAPQKAPKSEAERILARAKPDDFMGEEGCASCHEAKVAAFKASPHRAMLLDKKAPLDHQGCEGCHGAGSVHQDEKNPEVISFTKMSPKESSAACLRCHESTLDKSHWKGTAHAQNDLSCVSCHQIHPDSEPTWEQAALKKGKVDDPRSPLYGAKFEPKAMLKADETKLCGQCHASSVAEFRQSNHHPVPEGRVTCSDCHSVHATKGSKFLRADDQRTCVKCHSEYAGPFVYAHDPVEGVSGEGCLECHKAHGSSQGKLLQSSSRGLCAQCHTEKLAQHYPGQTCWTAGCHVAPHGSNSDPRFLKH